MSDVKARGAGLILYRSDLLPDNPGVSWGRVVCPSCGGKETGYYEVCIYRRRAFVIDGQLDGSRIDSELDQTEDVKDVSGRVICDCVTCGYEWVPVL